MPKSLEDFIWVLFLAITAVLFYLAKRMFSKYEQRLDTICGNCITKSVADTVKEELRVLKIAVSADLKELKTDFLNEIEEIRAKQQELRDILPEKYAKREDLKEYVGNLKDRFKNIDESLQFLIEETFKSGKRNP